MKLLQPPSTLDKYAGLRLAEEELKRIDKEANPSPCRKICGDDIKWSDFSTWILDLRRVTASRLAANVFKAAPALGNVFRGKSDYGILSKVLDPQEVVSRSRPALAILGPGPTKNYFKTGEEDHTHDEASHSH